MNIAMPLTPLVLCAQPHHHHAMRTPPSCSLKRVDYLLFDLDGTLYDMDTGYRDHIRSNARRFLVERLGVPEDEVGTDPSNQTATSFPSISTAHPLPLTTQGGLPVVGEGTDQGMIEPEMPNSLPIPPAPAKASVACGRWRTSA